MIFKDIGIGCSVLLFIVFALGLGPLLISFVEFLWQEKWLAAALIIGGLIGIANMFSGNGSSLTEEDKRRIRVIDWEERHPHN